MVIATRWEIEKKLMEQVLPEFVPFYSGAAFGFQGTLRGPRTGQAYRVMLRAKAKLYPCVAPSIFIEPRPDPRMHSVNGELSYLCAWKPKSSSFAIVALLAMEYIAECDGCRSAVAEPTV